MPYHLNAKTGNPNLCRAKNCTLEHFETKEEAQKFGAPKETVGDKLDHAVTKVEEELVKDSAFTEAKQEGASDAKAEVIAEKEAAKVEEVRSMVENGPDPTYRDGNSPLPHSRPRSTKATRALNQIKKDIQVISSKFKKTRSS